ncbi:MAG: helix-turn-helix domain-containing protein [Clostridia bacterium]|nr:helix-turn-helix domain-containing protein [Clostridia bacterium]
MTLKELRLNNGYTQQYVANRMGVSLSTYRRYETDIRNLRYAPITRAIALADLYKTTTDYILFDICTIICVKAQRK